MIFSFSLIVQILLNQIFQGFASFNYWYHNANHFHCLRMLLAILPLKHYKINFYFAIFQSSAGGILEWSIKPRRVQGS